MSTARTTELTLSARANAYVALTKPDVSFLVLMTTAATTLCVLDWLDPIQPIDATARSKNPIRVPQPYHHAENFALWSWSSAASRIASSFLSWFFRASSGVWRVRPHAVRRRGRR